MRTRSLDQLVDEIAEDLSRRKRELTTYRLLLEGSRKHERLPLLRAAMCMLYANWEGFVKAAAIRYVSFVASRGLKLRDLTPNFVVLGVRSEIAIASQTDKPSAHIALIEKLMLGLSSPANIDWEKAVNTYSNLDSKTLSEILRLLGIDGKDYLLRAQFLDQKLVAKRNLIAHGLFADVQLEDYLVLHGEIIQLVEMFRTDVENAAIAGSFRA